jgi:leishmanolysin-like peptidase
VAWALTCQSDALTGRPIAGHVNLNPASISSDSKGAREQLHTVIHETMHALGFSSQGLNEFRKPGTFDRIGSLSEVLWEGQDTTLGKAVKKVITPNVVAQAKQHFNCYNNWPNAGVELEDFGGGGTASSHWEKRLFYNDIMSGFSEPVSYKSAVTLAYFQDSGWYQVDYAAAERLPWGNGEGCAFVQQKCVGSGAWDKRYVCAEADAGKQGCTVDGMVKARCLLSKGITDIPPWGRYYASDATKGGLASADYCM